MSSVTAVRDKDAQHVIRVSASLKSAEEVADLINLLKAVSDGIFDKEIIFPVEEEPVKAPRPKLGIA